MKLNMDEDTVDLYRDTPVRLLGYANEVGEAFRPLVHVNWVRLSYGIANAYVLADTYDKTKKVKESKTEASHTSNVIAVAADTLIWQVLASIIIPGFTINRIIAGSNYALKRTVKLPTLTRKWITTIIGLSCIPFIFKPIDDFVDFAMDNTLRKVIRTNRQTKDQ